MDLPKSKPMINSDKKRVFLEEYEFQGLSRAWGKISTDVKAGNGEAAQLFNTHYEWCIQFPPDYSKLTPGVKYALRFRVRVDAKPGKKGQAFWCGLYSETNRRSIGEIGPNVTEMDGEYHWYTAATNWLPDPKEHVNIWAGPGRFTDNNETSINAVYFDCLEIVPVDEINDK